jgi:hypothetical protein
VVSVSDRDALQLRRIRQLDATHLAPALFFDACHVGQLPRRASDSTLLAVYWLIFTIAFVGVVAIFCPCIELFCVKSWFLRRMGSTAEGRLQCRLRH